MKGYHIVPPLDGLVLAHDRSKTSAMMHQRNILYFIFFSLVICTAFAYWNVDKCDFVSIDDHQYVSKNHHVMAGISGENLKWAFTTFEAANWHPLTWLSHALDCMLYGDRPAGPHLTNLVFHLINTLLLFFVLRSLTGSVWKSAFVAALFGLHPLHVESVAWVSERKDVLSTMLLFLSLLCYSRYVSRKKPKDYAGSFAFFCLGLLAKPMLVTLPFVMLLLDFWPLKRFSNRSVVGPQTGPEKPKTYWPILVAEKIPFFVVSAGSCVVTAIAQHLGDAIVKTTDLPFANRLANAAVSYASYLGNMFWPARLCFFYPIPHHISLAPVLLACVILAAISIVVVLQTTKHPYLFTGWLWFLGTLVPVIGIVQVGSQAMADRYTYVPLIGPFIMITWLLYDISKHSRFLQISIITTCVGVLAVLTMATRVQCAYWKNDFTLANHALAVTKDNFLAYSIKGNFLLDQGCNSEAIDCFRKSLALCPSQTTPRLNVGLILLRQGKPHEAIDAFKPLLALDSNNTLANLDCGNAYGLLGDTLAAIRCFRRAITVEPWFAAALHNLGVTYGAMKHYSDCRHYLLEAVRANPKDAESFLALGNCCLLDSSPGEAIQWYRKSIELAPRHADTHRQLAKAFEACGNGDSARYSRFVADSLAMLEPKNAKP